MVTIQANRKSLKKAEVLIIILQSHPASFDGRQTVPHLEFKIKESFLASAS